MDQKNHLASPGRCLHQAGHEIYQQLNTPTRPPPYCNALADWLASVGRGDWTVARERAAEGRADATGDGIVLQPSFLVGAQVALIGLAQKDSRLAKAPGSG
jgi:hypothetical protein